MPARDKPEKIRLDQLVLARGLADSREQARGLILAGRVKVDGFVADKPGTGYFADCDIEVKNDITYASRGGEKLAHAVRVFRPSIEGLVAVDVGASTGGFTDVLLRSGASIVYAVDVGRGQLAWKLQQHPRVKVMDKTNARYLTPEMFDPRPEFATVDVAFISLAKILPALGGVLPHGAHAICLVKPQFEAGRDKVGKHGVVRSQAVHAEVIRACIGHAAANGFEVLGMTQSPIRGPEGNVEFLMYLARRDGSASEPMPGQRLDALVAQAMESPCVDGRCDEGKP